MTEREEIEQAIAQLEGQRGLLDDATIDAALLGLSQRLETLDAAADETQPDVDRRKQKGERPPF